MLKPNVTKLYKYTSFSQRALAILIDDKIWYPSPKCLNDPFDCALVEYARTPEELKVKRLKAISIAFPRIKATGDNDLEFRLRELYRGFLSKVTKRDLELNKHIISLRDDLQKDIGKFGILSLSATPLSILMWSHYSHNHTGLCIEFERTPDNILGRDAEPVRYVSVHSRNNTDSDIFLNKFNGWRYEKEWRLLGCPGDKLHPVPGRISAVICGAKMPPEDLETLKRLIAMKNNKSECKMQLKRAEMQDESYVISITKVQLDRDESSRS